MCTWKPKFSLCWFLLWRWSSCQLYPTLWDLARTLVAWLHGRSRGALAADTETMKQSMPQLCALVSNKIWISKLVYLKPWASNGQAKESCNSTSESQFLIQHMNGCWRTTTLNKHVHLLFRSFLCAKPTMNHKLSWLVPKPKRPTQVPNIRHMDEGSAAMGTQLFINIQTASLNTSLAISFQTQKWNLWTILVQIQISELLIKGQPA